MESSIITGAAAGGYAAFPDICRAPNGGLLCVFYSGYAHVSTPDEAWPKGGRIMAIRSRDDGGSWSAPVVIADTGHDDRDPHVATLSDGTMLCNWFAAAHPQKPLPGGKPHALFLARSTDSGAMWTTWGDFVTIGENSGQHLDAETDVIALKDGSLLAALRSSKTDLFFARSTDMGLTWSEVKSSGFPGHCPHFFRHSSGTILLAHRLPATALHWSNDEGKSWQGPLQLDTVTGAYPSSIDLPGGDVLCVYYEEGKGSGLRAVRLRVADGRVAVLDGAW